MRNLLLLGVLAVYTPAPAQDVSSYVNNNPCVLTAHSNNAALVTYVDKDEVQRTREIGPWETFVYAFTPRPQQRLEIGIQVPQYNPDNGTPAVTVRIYANGKQWRQDAKVGPQADNAWLFGRW